MHALYYALLWVCVRHRCLRFRTAAAEVEDRVYDLTRRSREHERLRQRFEKVQTL